MLPENSLAMALDDTTETTAKPFPKVLRRASEIDYFKFFEEEKEKNKAEETRLLAEVEPTISAVEARLNQGYPYARLVTSSGVDPELLSRMLARELPFSGSDNYTMEDRAKTEQLLKVWLDDDARERQRRPGRAPTPTLKAIYNFGVEAMNNALLAVHVGGVGTGKSWAAEALVADYPRRYNRPGAVVVEMREIDKTVPKCLAGILAGLRNGPRRSFGDNAYDLICKELRPGDLVILDEANRLEKCDHGAMVDVLRDLWKETGAGFLLLGNPILKGKRAVLNNELYDAFASRARIQEILYNSQADVEGWMIWMGLSGKQLTKRFIELAARWIDTNGKEHFPDPGGLRKLANIVEDVKRRNPDADLTGDLVMSDIKNRGRV